MKPLLVFSIAVALIGGNASAQPAGSPVHMVVTAEAAHGAPSVALADVAAWQGRTRLKVTDWVPLRADNAGLALYILIDERVDPAQTALFDQLRRFVAQQAPATAVGVAYMFNGEARIAHTPTTDHALAAASLRVTSGSDSAGASPFLSLSALLNQWIEGGIARREVLAVTDGIDRFEDVGDLNMYVAQTTADAQRAGVPVYCLYAPALGHAGHSPALKRWGQTYLGQLAEETGGETYLDGSVELYLADLNKHFANQYEATFLSPPPDGAGFRAVRFTTSLPGVDLISAYGYFGRLSGSQP